MRSDSPSSPHKTSTSSDTEDYPVWKRWGDLDEHGKPRSPSKPALPREGGPDQTQAPSRRQAENPSPVTSEPESNGKSGHESGASPPSQRATNEKSDPSWSSDNLDESHRHASNIDPRSWESEFSAFDIRDKVVIMLLFKQVVQIEEVETAWRRFRSVNQGRSREPLWRILARDPAFNRDRILAEAARVAGFDAAEINPVHAATFIESHLNSFSEREWERMLALSVVPVAKEEDPRSGRDRLVFVAPDPTRPGVAKLLRDLEVDSYVLRYAPERVIDSLLADLTTQGQASPESSQTPIPDSTEASQSASHFQPNEAEQEASRAAMESAGAEDSAGTMESADVEDSPGTVESVDAEDAPRVLDSSAAAAHPLPAGMDSADVEPTSDTEPLPDDEDTSDTETQAKISELIASFVANPARKSGPPASSADNLTKESAISSAATPPSTAEDSPSTAQDSASTAQDSPSTAQDSVSTQDTFSSEDMSPRSAEETPSAVDPAEESKPAATPVSDQPPASSEAHALFEACFSDAVNRKASGIHLLPVDEGLQIDMRINGELERWRVCPHDMGDELLSVVKKSALNIRPAESDTVQDGMITRQVGDVTVRFRVSVLPIAGGWSEGRRESVVISMMGDRSTATDLDGLGLPEETLTHLREAVVEPRGMVVLAGPSGSGRAATLSAILHEIVTPKVNVITLEESVSLAAEGVRQVRLSHKLDPEEALEAVRRHDPDIILVGELRSKATAELALKLANAGHLVFSRLPAHDTTGVVSRLLRLEVDPFLIAYAINLVVAQRLVRRLCPDCKQPARHVDGELLRRLGFSRHKIASTTFYGEGEKAECPTCGGSGYDGTQIIAEAMPFTHDTRRLIALADASLDDEDVRAQAVGEGMTTIRASAREVVLRGDTSVDELIRATAGGN